MDTLISFVYYFICCIKKYYYSSVFSTLIFQLCPKPQHSIKILVFFLLPAVAYSQHPHTTNRCTTLKSDAYEELKKKKVMLKGLFSTLTLATVRPFTHVKEYLNMYYSSLVPLTNIRIFIDSGCFRIMCLL